MWPTPTTALVEFRGYYPRRGLDFAVPCQHYTLLWLGHVSLHLPQALSGYKLSNAIFWNALRGNTHLACYTPGGSFLWIILGVYPLGFSCWRNTL